MNAFLICLFVIWSWAWRVSRSDHKTKSCCLYVLGLINSYARCICIMKIYTYDFIDQAGNSGQDMLSVTSIYVDIVVNVSGSGWRALVFIYYWYIKFCCWLRKWMTSIGILIVDIFNVAVGSGSGWPVLVFILRCTSIFCYKQVYLPTTCWGI